MSRTLTVAAQNALDAEHVWYVALIELGFDSGTIRLSNASYDITWNSQTWLGGGRFCSLEPIEETTNPAAAALALRLSGIQSGYISRILTEHYQGRAAKIWFAPLDANLQAIADPVQMFSGRMDEPEVTIGETADIVLRLENRWADWDRPRTRRYNSADQEARFSGDRFFEYAESMDGLDMIWGTIIGPTGPKPPKLVRKITQELTNLGDSIADFFGW